MITIKELSRKDYKRDHKDIDINNYNKSTIFIRPMLGYSPLFYGERFYNCYIELDENIQDKLKNNLKLNNYIYIVYKYPIYIENFNALTSFEEHLDFVEEKKIENKYIIFKFSVPEQFEDDFLLFLSGSYSKFSNNYKEEILSLNSYWSSIYNNISKILFPNKKHRKEIEEFLDVKLSANAEIFSKPDLNKEIFNIKKLK
jgi:hypothetical protein